MKIQRRTLITAVSMGTFIEWYDYALFGYLSKTIAQVFFPSRQGSTALFETFLFFGIGFLMRPLGSIIFGIIGDKYGRKKALLLSILLITLPTFLMGALPTYAQIGMTASITLALLRILQGVPIGGEIGGVICYLVEVAPKEKRSFFSSWVFLGCQLGLIVSSLEIYAFKSWLSAGAFLEWGWRLSLFVGGIIGLFGLYLRRQLVESPAFEYVMHHHLIVKNPFRMVLREHWKKMLQACGISALTAAGYYTVFVFSTLYFAEILGMNFIQNLLINLGMIIFSTGFLPVFGKLGDRYGAREGMMVSSLFSGAFSFLTYYFAGLKAFYFMFLFQGLLILSITVNYALLSAVLYELFPAQVRYTGIAFSYNVCNAIIGGMAPLIALYLIHVTGSNASPSYLLIVVALITFFSLFNRNTPVSVKKGES